MSAITEEIRKFVEEECRKPTSKYGYEPFERHFLSVVRIAKKLALKRNADLEIVELSAWLHDIGSIIYGRENHHITSSEIAEKKLRELGYPEEKIAKVKQSILSHRGSKDITPESTEAKILAEADAIDAFNRIEGLFMAAFVHEGLSQKDGLNSVKKKLRSKYAQLSPEGKELIKNKYDAAMLLLE